MPGLTRHPEEITNYGELRDTHGITGHPGNCELRDTREYGEFRDTHEITVSFFSHIF